MVKIIAICSDFEKVVQELDLASAIRVREWPFSTWILSDEDYSNLSAADWKDGWGIWCASKKRFIPQD